MRLQIDNEYDKLEAVLVHRPGAEIERLTHGNMSQYLFEDLPFLRRMQDEHDSFVEKMRGQDIEVVYLEKLLGDLLADEAQRHTLLSHVCDTASVPAIADELASLNHWDLNELVESLFAGITAGEYHERTGGRIEAAGGADHFLIPPIPNAYFSRDPAVVVRDAAISSKMHFEQRIRESQLVRFVLENHIEFRDHTIAYGGTSEPTEDRPFTIEGGDVIILSEQAVIVGVSERTRSETIEILAGKCFQEGKVERVYEIPIPADRAFMHLDTVFTVIDRGMVLWFAPVIADVERIQRYEPADPSEHHGTVRIQETRSFLEVLADEFQTDVTVIDTGGGSTHFASREQRMDGTNALAIAPRLAITYERNERTVAALEANGVTCINIEGSELVRGLGGPRCMTMPLRRASD